MSDGTTKQPVQTQVKPTNAVDTTTVKKETTPT